MVEFAGATSTGCGAASSSTGPFYCPADQTIDIDLTFYDLLQSSYGASGGPLADALSAAQAVGDDHIQQQSGGGVQPETWTHGSSEQRQRWFTTGYTEQAPGACDTFAATEL